MKVSGSKLYSIYLSLVSFVSVIAIAITLGIVLTSLGKYLIISDDEYIENRDYYKLEQCENNIYNRGIDDSIKQIPKTSEEIEQCKADARESSIKSRAYNLKDMFITSFSWLIVFIIVFLFHYPKFLREKDDK